MNTSPEARKNLQCALWAQEKVGMCQVNCETTFLAIAFQDQNEY